MPEGSDPRRIFISTVRIGGGEIKLVPIRTDKPINKDNWEHVAKEVKLFLLETNRLFIDNKNGFHRKRGNLVTVRKIN